MLSMSRVSTGRAVASPPASWISRSTVFMVDCKEFGSGGKGFVLLGSDMDLAATTTAVDLVSIRFFSFVLQEADGYLPIEGN